MMECFQMHGPKCDKGINLNSLIHVPFVSTEVRFGFALRDLFHEQTLIDVIREM